jgi:hypothetical protein
MIEIDGAPAPSTHARLAKKAPESPKNYCDPRRPRIKIPISYQSPQFCAGPKRLASAFFDPRFQTHFFSSLLACILNWMAIRSPVMPETPMNLETSELL